MRYSRVVIEHFYACCAHTWSAQTDSCLRQQVNTNDLSAPTGPHYGPSASLNASHACHLHITSSIQTNQIYNIIYSLNIMISKGLHLFK